MPVFQQKPLEAWDVELFVPADLKDAPRGIQGDWLEDQGQIELATLVRKVPEPVDPQETE